MSISAWILLVFVWWLTCGAAVVFGAWWATRKHPIKPLRLEEPWRN